MGLTPSFAIGINLSKAEHELLSEFRDIIEEKRFGKQELLANLANNWIYIPFWSGLKGNRNVANHRPIPDLGFISELLDFFKDLKKQHSLKNKISFITELDGLQEEKLFLGFCYPFKEDDEITIETLQSHSLDVKILPDNYFMDDFGVGQGEIDCALLGEYDRTLLYSYSFTPWREVAGEVSYSNSLTQAMILNEGISANWFVEKYNELLKKFKQTLKTMEVEVDESLIGMNLWAESFVDIDWPKTSAGVSD